MRKIVLTYGLLAGAVLAGVMLAVFPFREQVGFDHAAVVGYTSMVAAFLMIYFGVRSYRDTVAGGQVGFWKACQVGALIMLVGTVCYVATWEFVYFQLMPDFTEHYAAYLLDKMKAAGATEAALAAKAKELADFKVMYDKPLVNIAFTFLEPLPVGLLFTLVSAWLVSRRPGATRPAAAVTA